MSKKTNAKLHFSDLFGGDLVGSVFSSRPIDDSDCGRAGDSLRLSEKQ